MDDDIEEPDLEEEEILDEDEDEEEYEIEEHIESLGYIVEAANLPKSRNKKTIIDLGRDKFLVIEAGKRYTPAQIDEMTDELFRSEMRQIDPDTGRPKGIKGIGGEAPFLLEEHYRYRRRREIYNTTGIADPYLSRLAAERYRNNTPKNNIDY